MGALQNAARPFSALLKSCFLLFEKSAPCCFFGNTGYFIVLTE